MLVCLCACVCLSVYARESANIKEFYSFTFTFNTYLTDLHFLFRYQILFSVVVIIANIS